MTLPFQGNYMFKHGKPSPFTARAGNAALGKGTTFSAAQSAAKPKPDSVMFSGGHVSPIKELSNISDGRMFNVPFTLDIAESSHVGNITAGQNVWATDVTVKGDVTAQKGHIEFKSSDINGTLEAADSIDVTESKNIQDVKAGGDVYAEDVLVKGDVLSKNGNIRFINSDSKGKLQALKGHVEVNDSDEIGSIDAAGDVSVRDAKEVKGPITSDGTGSLHGKNTVVNDIVIRKNQTGRKPQVAIGEGVTVKGNITFEDGAGDVFMDKDAKLLGKTNGRVENRKLFPRQSINYCDPNKKDFSDGDKCDPTISEQHNPFNLTPDQINNATQCGAANANRGPSKKSMFLAALLASGLILGGNR